MRATRDFAEPTRFRPEGDENPSVIPADMLSPPPLDASWHGYGACASEDQAQVALEQVLRDKARPWAQWCDVCPVRAHCLELGLSEDEWQPMRTVGRKGSQHGEKYVPMIYGGLTPAERRNMGPFEKRQHAARLRWEKGWLARQWRKLRAS